MKRIISFVASICIILSTCLHVEAQVFPDEIQACFDSGQCTLIASQPFTLDTIFHFYQDNSGVERVLVRYSLGTGSENQGTFEDNPTITTELSGIVWLMGRRQYDLSSSSFNFTMYLEDVEPADVFNSFGFTPHPFSVWFVNADAFLAGTADYFTDIDMEIPDGDLRSEGPQFCLSETCAVGASLTFVNFEYAEAGNSGVAEFQTQLFNNGLFYEHSRSFDGFDPPKPSKAFFECQKFVVGAVPTLFGDVNLDGNIDLLDVGPFVDLLTIGAYQFEADINFDLVVDLQDVLPFVLLLSG